LIKSIIVEIQKNCTFRRAGCAGRYEWGAAPGVNQQSTGNLARQPLLKGAVCKVPC